MPSNKMPNTHLPNYIRTYRKRVRLTQEEIAFLLGLKSSAVICRHERFRQTPNLQTLLAYEILFRTPVRNLFSGVNHKVESKLKRRIRLLIQKLAELKQDRSTAEKIKILETFLQERAAATQA